MKTALFSIFLLFVLLLPGMTMAQGGFTLDHVDGEVAPGQLGTDVTIVFYIRLTNATGVAITGNTNGFRVCSSDGAQWTTTVPASTGTITTEMYDSDVLINEFSIDGIGCDTVGFGGFRMFKPGIPNGFDDIVFFVI